MTQTILPTDRLTLVPLHDEHLDLEFELDSDPEVMRYLTGRARTRDEVVAAHGLRMAAADPVPGLGFWIGFAGELFIGWWLLKPPGRIEGELVDGQAELGYRLLRRHWRQGFASEGSRELLRHAFEDLGLQRVFARTMTVNAASRATMASVGMQYVRAFAVDDDGPEGAELGGVEYAITHDEWLHARRAGHPDHDGAVHC